MRRTSSSNPTVRQWRSGAPGETRILLLSIFLAVMALISCDCDVMETRYADYDEAVADSAFERGWIPAFLPKSAYDITDRHNLDNNETWVTFRFTESDLDSMASCLIVADSTQEIEIRRVMSDEFSVEPDDVSVYLGIRRKLSKHGQFVAIDTSLWKCYFYRM